MFYLKRLESYRRYQASDATTLPTEPQPLPSMYNSSSSIVLLQLDSFGSRYKGRLGI